MRILSKMTVAAEVDESDAEEGQNGALDEEGSDEDSIFIPINSN